MDDQRVGAILRAVRRRRGWRQSDVATKAGVSQSTVSRIERGHTEGLRLDDIRLVARDLDVTLSLDPRWRGAELGRLVDRDHAALVERVVATLDSVGWDIVPEYSFNHYGDRGSVDVLAWHSASRSLLIVEVKVRLADLQDLLATTDRKRRVVPPLVLSRGWRAEQVGLLVLAADTTWNREAIGRHAATLRAVVPHRGRDAMRWIRRPEGGLQAIWLTRLIPRRNGMRPAGGPDRVRVSR
jgi:transcriptional regulator with XRE-family HTH domain